MRDSDSKVQLFIFLGIGMALAIVSLAGVGAEIQSRIAEPVLSSVSGVTQLFRAVDGYTSLFSSLQEVRDENLKYKNRVAELETQLNEQEELQEENKWLRSQLVLELPRPQTGSISKVLKYEYSPSIGYIYINVSADVSVGDFATVYDYIVGEVVDIKGDIARVRLLAANDTNLLVKIGDESVVGKLKGGSGLGIVVEEVQANSQIKVNDEIKLLSPVGPYATHYELGKVSKIEGTPADPLWALSVDFPVDLFKLEYVIIIPNHE